jgi:penicillin-binding protein 1A
MQVARNVHRRRESTRKIYEVLPFKLERSLSKNQILEIYMNQIFSVKSPCRFCRRCRNLFWQAACWMLIAEAAMLAGLPKAPSTYNPIAVPAAPMRQLLHH